MNNHTNATAPRLDRRTFLALALLAIAVALPRFAHTTPDSAYYIALADYFKGDVARGELTTPFAYRWLSPWLAAQVSALSSATALALCSLCATLGTCAAFARLLPQLLETRTQVLSGLAVLIVSFPTFNYGAAVLTDAAGLLVLAAAACAMVERRFGMLVLVLAAGAGVRETTLLMLPVLWIYYAPRRDGRGLAAAGVATLAALGAAWLARWYVADLPAYLWTPSWGRFAENLARPVSWATVLLTLAPVSTLAAAGARHWRDMPVKTRHFVVATGVPGLALLGYSVAAAYMSGRFCWPLYLALTPLAAVGAEAALRRWGATLHP